MASAFRDLDRLDDAEEVRHKRGNAMIGIAVVVSVSLLASAGFVRLRHVAPMAAARTDPLSRLSLTTESENFAETESAGRDPKAPNSSSAVERESLLFPQILADGDPPEVSAAIAAAAAEHEQLEQMPTMPVQEVVVPPSGSANPIPASNTAALSPESLARAGSADPLMAAALPSTPPVPIAPVGGAGLYTLQVMSFRSPEEAHDFVNQLRSREHRAFTVSAEVPERGIHWRVRIGPFKTLHEAEQYREKFEEQEGIHTFVVRERHESDHG